MPQTFNLISSYFIFAVQETDFSCSDRVAGGYYADPGQRCQAYHVCLQVCFVIFLFQYVLVQGCFFYWSALKMCQALRKSCHVFDGIYYEI